MAAGLSMAVLLALNGCSALQVKLGIKVPLAKIQVSTMEASLPKNPAIAPGEKSALVVTFTASDGKVWVTEGKGKGKILWSDLVVTSSVVTVNKKGIVSLAHDPRLSEGKTGHVTVTAQSQPGLHADLDIPLRYNVAFAANFSGVRGADGMNGSDGTDGMSGSDGSIDANNPSPGGNGTNGSDGSDGQDGSPGGDAPDVQIWLALRPGSSPLLQAGVLAAGHKERFYLVDPQGGTLTVTADGGAGGSGGKGGRGGRGGSGGIGIPSGSNGMDGHDGRNGFDGSMGRGGHITVTYDPQVKPYLSMLRLSNQGGPKPVFNEAPVKPLW
jgi:hypothetical protein